MLAVNAVVKTSQMQDAVHRGVLDACHYVPAIGTQNQKLLRCLAQDLVLVGHLKKCLVGVITAVEWSYLMSYSTC